MVDSVKRHSLGEGQALGKVDPDEQRSGEAGAVGHGYGVEMVQGEAGAAQGFVYDGQYAEDVLA